jgi:immune inhibitor A
MRPAPVPRRPLPRARALATSLVAAFVLTLLVPLGGLGATPEDTAAKLLAAVRPPRDSLSLAQRTRDIPAGAATQINPPRLTADDVGRVDRFTVEDQLQRVQHEIEADLRRVSPHGYWYVQRGRPLSDADLTRAVEDFETTIYPTVRRIVGGDKDIGAITILHTEMSLVIGYFSAADLQPRWVQPQSNERPMVYLDPNKVQPGSEAYRHTLSHELTHLYHFYVNPVEDTWIKEGLGELAQELIDPSYRYGVRSFLSRPSTPLTGWVQPPADVSVHYQAGYLFLQYFLQRYGGLDTLPALLAEAGRGPTTVDAYLAALGRPERFNEVFRDWVIANLVQDPAVAGSQYGYQRPPDGRPQVREIAAPRLEEGRVPQYGADYYALRRPARVQFQGTTTVPTIGADPPGGGNFWWSNRGDMMDTRLTRPLDLRGAQRATLTFDLRYDTEEAYDYGFAMISTDGGNRWQPLTGRYTTTANPTGNNFGAGYNGQSGGAGDTGGGAGAGAQWVREEMDLTPYAGQQVLLRFEYVTDDSFNADGLALAHVGVPEVGWQDDGSGWTAEGFVWIENVLPQTYAVQVVEYAGDRATVRQVPLDTSGQATIDLSRIGGEVTSAVLAVSGLAPTTLQPARYTLDVQTANP